MFLNYQDKISKGCAFCCRWTSQPARLLSPERRCCPNSAILIISAFNNTQNVKHLNLAAESVQQERLKKSRSKYTTALSLASISQLICFSLAGNAARSVNALRPSGCAAPRSCCLAARRPPPPLRCLRCAPRFLAGGVLGARSKSAAFPVAAALKKARVKTSGRAALAFSRSPARGVPLVLALQYLAPNFPAAPRPSPEVGGSARPRARLFPLSRRVTACLRKPALAGCAALGSSPAHFGQLAQSGQAMRFFPSLHLFYFFLSCSPK